MQTIFKLIINGFQEDFGYPASLIELLNNYPQLRLDLDRAHCISSSSVPAWHQLGSPSYGRWPTLESTVLQGWASRTRHRWEDVQVERAEFAQIGCRKVIPEWTCDISDIDGFAFSKSDLNKFPHTDVMVESNSPEMIDQITHEKLAENLAHRKIGIIHSPDTTDHFARYLWDGRLWLINNDGSHHTAAAKYIATKLGQKVSLKSKLYVYSLNASYCIFAPRF
jgi:hypothetical protein